MSQVEIIDPAFEITEVMRLMLEQPSSNDPTWSAMQRVVGGLGGADFWDLIAILHTRASRLQHLASTVQDNEFGEQLRTKVTQAISRFVRVFEPGQLSQVWSHTLQNYVRADDALQLNWFSLIAKRYQPLRRLSPEERQRLIEKIDEALKDIHQAQDIPQWAIEPLTEGMRRLRLIIANLTFFGCAAAIDALLTLNQQATLLDEELLKDSHSRHLSIIKILNVIVLAASLFWIPDQVNTAFKTYQGWLLELLVEHPRLPKQSQYLLEAPRLEGDGQTQPPDAEIAGVEPKLPGEEKSE